MSKKPKITVTDQDRERLALLIESYRGSTADLLEDELERARIVPQDAVPPDVVTMHSVVTFRDEGTGEAMEVALVYPENANASDGRVSVLAPMGAALLGMKVGQAIEWPVPDGKTRRIRVLSIAFQPEALGAFDL